jgi:hypothetical protein
MCEMGYHILAPCWLKPQWQTLHLNGLSLSWAFSWARSWFYEIVKIFSRRLEGVSYRTLNSFGVAFATELAFKPLKVCKIAQLWHYRVRMMTTPMWLKTLVRSSRLNREVGYLHLTTWGKPHPTELALGCFLSSVDGAFMCLAWISTFLTNEWKTCKIP